MLNGVYGFGINDIDSQRDAFHVLYAALAPGGLLLVGRNTKLQPDLEAREVFQSYFMSTGQDALPWPHRTCFELPETHVYDFYARRDGTSQFLNSRGLY